MICVGLVVMWCNVAAPSPTDSFCQTYQKIVQAKGDGSIQGSSGAKRRILTNELAFKKLCPGK